MSNVENNIVISTYDVRDYVLTNNIVNERMVTEHMVLNMMPINKINGKHVITDFKEYIDVDGVLPFIKKSANNKIKKYLNSVIKNIINKTLMMSIPDISVTDYSEERKELVELMREDDDVRMVLKDIDFEIMLNGGDNDEDIINMYNKNKDVTYLVTKYYINVFVIPDEYILKNDELEAGRIFRLNSNMLMFEYLQSAGIMDDNSEYLLYTTNGNSYLLCDSAYGYKTIKKWDINKYQTFNI